MTQQEAVAVTTESTPNPRSWKLNVNRTLIDGPGRDFPSKETVEGSLLPQALFNIPEVTGVYVGGNFVTVTITEESNWTSLEPTVKTAVVDHIQSGQSAVSAEATETSTGGDEVEQGIINILDTKVRPAVAMDGGDIVFSGFENGVVYLHLRGACSGCPSSLMTLKVGIENLLKEEFPEHVKSVEAV